MARWGMDGRQFDIQTDKQGALVDCQNYSVVQGFKQRETVRPPLVLGVSLADKFLITLNIS